MSVNAVEKALWQALTNKKDAVCFRDDAGRYLSDFALSDDERAGLLAWNVSALISYGVNPLLLMMTFSVIHGSEKRPEYAERAKGKWNKEASPTH